MLHFTELSTTVGWKPGRWQAVPLGPRVVVVGKNTAGKSRLITALSLLVSGKAPGEVFGKESEVALAGDLAMLYPTEDTETWGRTNDGRRLQPTKSGTPWVHPVRHIAGSLRKPSIADTFLGQFIIDPKADVAALIPAFYADEAKANTSRPKIPTTVSELLAALASAGEHIRALNQTVKQAEDGLANNNAIADVSNDQISAAAALVQTLEHDLSTVQARTSLTATRQQAMAAKEQREARLAELAAQAAALEPMLTQYDGEIGRVEAMRPTYADAVRQAEMGANGDLWRAMAALDASNPHSQGCPACASKIDRSAWKNWVQYNAEQAEHAVRNARQALSDLDVYLSKGKTGRSELGVKYDGLKREETWLAGQPPIVIPEVGGAVPERAEDVEKLRADLAQAKRVHADLLKQKGAADQMASLRARLVRAETDSVWWKAWRDALNSAHGILLSRGVASFEQHVQRYMPAQYTFRLILEKPQGAATFRFGLETDGDKHIIVSGAQRALILFALAATCLDRLPQEDRPQMPILMLDEERAIDGEHLTMLMQALSAAPYQVVVTSIVGPVKAVDGWQVLDLSTVSPTGEVALTSEVKKTRKPSTRKKDALVTADPYLDATLPLASGGVAAPVDTVPAVSDGELDSLMPRLV